jgi:hypothetical protein
VVAEAAYATIAVRPILANELGPSSPKSGERQLSYQELFWFHLPLAGTSLLSLLAQPLVTSSLTRLDNPTQSLAAWPVLFQMMLMARAAAFALPEVVIAIGRRADAFNSIRRFSFNLAGILTLMLALFTFTPVSTFYVFSVQDMSPVVGQMALSSLWLFLLFPALATITSWLRGLLINERATKDVNLGMAINLVITAAVLSFGVSRSLPGLPAAAVALNLASLGEVVYLGWRTFHRLDRALPVVNLEHRLS